MAKKKADAGGGPSKSQAIRDQLAKTPKATAAEVAAAAGKVVGEEVSIALVYNIKAAAGKKKKSRGKPGPKKAAAGGGVNLTLVKEAASLLQQAGGDPKAAKDALDLAAEVSKIVKK